MHRFRSCRRFLSLQVLSCLLCPTVLTYCVLILVSGGGRFPGKDARPTAQDRRKELLAQWSGDKARDVGEAVAGVGDRDIQLIDVETSVSSQQPDTPLSFIPPVPDHSTSDRVPVLTENITNEFLALPKKDYTERVVILTPVCDVALYLRRFAALLSALTYPHDLISVNFGEDSSSDSTFETAKQVATNLTQNNGFRQAHAFKLNISGGVHGGWSASHKRNAQELRRSHLAKARNLLLRLALRDEDWVLWIDSDVSHLPPDLVQQLLFGGNDVTVASCLFVQGTHIRRNYDKNSWRETEMSLEQQRHLSPDTVIVEGYSDTKRLFLPDLRAEGRIVPLDGVGGCALLVKATCHRLGLEFPEKPFKYHIETEGLAKLAKHMGFSVVGMPFVEVFH